MTAQRLAKRKILILDNDNESIEVTRTELLKFGYEILEADSVQEAHVKLIQNKIDVVIIDIELTHSSRKQLIKKILSQECGSPAIILMISSDVLTKDRAYSSGVSACLSKPYNTASLVSRIEHILYSKENKSSLSRKRNTTDIHSNVKNISVPLSDVEFGQGGFMTSTDNISAAPLEGELLQFEINESKMKVMGTGIVRYVKMSKITHQATSLGIEFESIYENTESLEHNELLNKIYKSKNSLYIPGTFESNIQDTSSKLN